MLCTEKYTPSQVKDSMGIKYQKDADEERFNELENTGQRTLKESIKKRKNKRKLKGMEDKSKTVPLTSKGEK